MVGPPFMAGVEGFISCWSDVRYLVVVMQPLIWVDKLLHCTPICLAPAIIAKARSKVVSDIQDLKPRSGEEHVCIVLYDIDITHDGQHFMKYSFTRLQSYIVEPKYKNLVHPSFPPAFDSFGQTVGVFYGIHAPNPLGDDFLLMGKFFDE